MWQDSGSKCLMDVDGDGVVGDADNCPRTYNPTQNNTYCRKPPGAMEVGGVCVGEDFGDHCDDTDGDGVLDWDELNDTDLDPLDFDSDDNCINDGVEHMIDPIVRILSGMAIGVATVMLLYVGLKWLTSDDEQSRANAKAAVVYIMIGLILLAGGKDLVIFILQTKCPPEETPQLKLNSTEDEVWLCPISCGGNLTMPVICCLYTTAAIPPMPPMVFRQCMTASRCNLYGGSEVDQSQCPGGTCA